MAKMTLEEINKYDQRKAAYHEAGHVVVAAILEKQYWRAYLFPTETTDTMKEKTIVGRAEGAGRHTRETGLGGVLGEWVKEDSDMAAEDIVELLEDGAIHKLSDTDKVAIALDGEDCWQLIPAIEKTWQCLKDNEIFLDWVATELINDGVVTDGMVKDYVAQMPNANERSA